MKKRGYTVIEVLLASGIFAFILAIGMSIIALMTNSLFNNQIEASKRTNINDTIFFITREIQSAEKIKIEDEGKKLLIKRRGSDGYNIVYEIEEGYPTDTFFFKDKKIADIDYDKSRFSYEENTVKLELAILKNNTEVNQIHRLINLNITPRSEGVMLE